MRFLAGVTEVHRATVTVAGGDLRRGFIDRHAFVHHQRAGRRQAPVQHANLPHQAHDDKRHGHQQHPEQNVGNNQAFHFDYLPINLSRRGEFASRPSAAA
ncbi:hypothetical protein D3C76_1673140 [compost metagenome]